MDIQRVLAFAARSKWTSTFPIPHRVKFYQLNPYIYEIRKIFGSCNHIVSLLFRDFIKRTASIQFGTLDYS